MNDNINSESHREEFLFQHLIAMFQTLALQQLGKLINPMSGESIRDLDQARITIDMLGMIKEKTRGNLSANEQKLLDKVLMELQMNYVTEREEKEDEGGEEKKGAKEEGQKDEEGEGGSKENEDEEDRDMDDEAEGEKD